MDLTLNNNTEQEVDSEVIALSQPQPDNTEFEITFDIPRMQQYVLRVVADNGENSTTNFYVIDVDGCKYNNRD